MESGIIANAGSIIGQKLSGLSDEAGMLRECLSKVAPLDSTVLLTGETGTGKGHAARAVHAASPRATKPFVHVDCAALSPTLIESELFGHEKGAFTNAATRRVGRFEWAADGTVFLDEIGDLDPRLQSKLLRVLDDRVFERLGGTQTLAMRARIISATSHDLINAVQRARFRSDLYFRLQVFHFHIPPLRDRLEDLPELVAEGVTRVCNRLGLGVPVISEAFVARLRGYDWPGNVRELLNAIERSVVTCEGGRLRPDDLDGALGIPRVTIDDWPDVPASTHSDWSLTDLRGRVESEECREIVSALEASRGNVAGAARRLRIARSTLRHRIAKYNLEGELADGDGPDPFREVGGPEK